MNDLALANMTLHLGINMDASVSNEICVTRKL
jgi:hypothetical protein